MAPAIVEERVEARLLIEALAVIGAAASVFSELDHADEALVEFFQGKCSEITNDAFGPGPDDDEEWLREPRRVKCEARGAELASEAFALARMPSYSTAYAKQANAIRELGTFSNVPLELDREKVKVETLGYDLLDQLLGVKAGLETITDNLYAGEARERGELADEGGS